MLVVVALLAVLVGLALGLLGGGGSILTVPLLVYVAGVDPKQAIAASLFVVGTTSLVGLISHARAGRVRWKTGLIFGAAGMAGAFVGGRVGTYMPGTLLLVGFALMMVATAVAMIRGRRSVAAHDAAGLPVARILLDGAVVGLVTGMVGAGGGFLVVPALALLGGMPMPAAVGTSLLVIAMKSFAGFAGYATSVEVPWTITLIVTGGAVVGALAGSMLAGRVHPDRLRSGFGWFVLVMAAVILIQELPDGALAAGLGSPWIWAGLAAVAVVAGVVIARRVRRRALAGSGPVDRGTPDPAEAASAAITAGSAGGPD